MWMKDKENYEIEEKKLHERIKKINYDNQKFLNSQMENKLRKKKEKMNQNEAQLNRDLLRQAN